MFLRSEALLTPKLNLLMVNFSTSSPGPVWNWNFGDAGTANTQNASHTYVTAGNFNVFLALLKKSVLNKAFRGEL
jgi:hypothetical protein